MRNFFPCFFFLFGRVLFLREVGFTGNGFKGLLLYTQCFYHGTARRGKRGKGRREAEGFTGVKLLMGFFMI